MKLKTLKDITWENVTIATGILNKRLRDNAIERYKYWEKMVTSPPDMDMLVNHLQIYGRMAELRDLYNLTEGDLK